MTDGFSSHSSSPGPHVLLDLPSEPLYPLLQSLPRGGVTGADVPWLVQDPLQTWQNDELIITRTYVALHCSSQFVVNNITTGIAK